MTKTAILEKRSYPFPPQIPRPPSALTEQAVYEEHLNAIADDERWEAEASYDISEREEFYNAFVENLSKFMQKKLIRFLPLLNFHYHFISEDVRHLFPDTKSLPDPYMTNAHINEHSYLSYDETTKGFFGRKSREEVINLRDISRMIGLFAGHPIRSLEDLNKPPTLRKEVHSRATIDLLVKAIMSSAAVPLKHFEAQEYEHDTN